MTALLRKLDRTRLLANGRKQAAAHAAGGHLDLTPIVKLFDPNGSSTWLLTEIDPNDEDRAFGLCDVGHGEPELGWVSLAEISRLLGRWGLGIERDRWFRPHQTLTRYAAQARARGQIVA